MIKDILLVTGGLFAVASLGLFLITLMRAPEGNEDEAGFHYHKRGSPASRPPFAPEGSRGLKKENSRPARHHISAA